MPRGSGHPPRLPGRRSTHGDPSRLPSTGAPIDVGLSLSVSALDPEANDLSASGRRAPPWPTEH